MAKNDELKRRGRTVNQRLAKEYPDSGCSLRHVSPYELLVATILSAQCTDARVNIVTPPFFRRFPGPEKLAVARITEIEKLIRSTGFYHNKAKSLKGMAQAVVSRHDGHVPSSMEELTLLPGVGRKTANVVLGNSFGIPGVTVDTHVQRISRRLGLTAQTDPNKIEQDLMAVIPRKDWTVFSHRMITHGRRVCDARRPRCEECVLRRLCDYFESSR